MKTVVKSGGGLESPEPDPPTQLVQSAASWIREAMTAWANDDFAKVAALAPLAVEHLGKAVLWRENPVLLVPLAQDGETSLFLLATKPTLADPRLRTVTLTPILGRLDKVLGGLPVDPARRKRLVDSRNGAMHVGQAEPSRHVLLDALTLCQVMLSHLGEAEDAFFGEHFPSVCELLDAKRTEVGYRVSAKRARARHRLVELEERLGSALFADTTSALQAETDLKVDPEDFGNGYFGVPETCPECGLEGRLIGSVSVDFDVDWDVEPLGGGQYEPVPMSVVVTDLSPSVFVCHVCGLELTDPEELAEADLPSRSMVVNESDLGAKFDVQQFLDAK